MGVIFLDHLGVMCPVASKDGVIDFSKIEGRSFIPFCPMCVNLLNEFLEVTGFDIVISSDWKLWAGFDDMCSFYKSQGVLRKPLGYTPFFSGEKRGIDIRRQRVFEIESWLLKENHVNNWVAIDDLKLDGLSNFVWVYDVSRGISGDGIIENLFEKVGMG